MSALAEMKHEWKAFKHDAPGTRFKKHHRRTKQTASKAGLVVRALLGVVLLAGGVLFMFIPGPGLPLVVFGLALLASLSRRLAGVLDRMEMPLRHAWNVTKRRWAGLPVAAKIALGVVAAGVAGAVAYAAWRHFFA